MFSSLFVQLFARDGVDAHIPNPRGQHLANLSIIFACLSFVFVSCRLCTRYFVNKSIGTDDYLIVPATALAITMAVSFNMEVKNGFGLHANQVSNHHLIEALKWFFVAQLLYKVSICLTKLSILFFFVRIFPSQNFKRAVTALGAITVAYSFASVCCTIWQCDPIAKTWNRKLSGHCLEIGKVWYSTSVMAVITDVAIIILPVYQIRRLQMPLFQKLALCLMFSLGIFVIACTVVRMAVVGPAITALDTPYYQVTSNSWTFLEANVAIIVTCIPTLKWPIVRLFPCLESRSKSATTSYPYGFSRENYTSKIVSSQGRSYVGPDRSDEEFIQTSTELAEVRMTTNIDITYEDAKKMDMDDQKRVPLSPPPKY